MASEWQAVLLGDVADELTVGHVGPMASEYVQNGVPFLRSQNVEPHRIVTEDTKFISQEFHERLRKSALSPGDVVIVRSGRPGAAAVIPDDLVPANCADLVIVRPGKNLDSRFLSYYINSAAAGHVDAYIVGAVQQHFNVESARKIRLSLPPLPEQRAIAHVLGTLDDKIENNRRMNETLEAMARAIFKSWFVNFDPVRAKAEGRSPPGMDAATAALFPDRFEDSALGEIPRGWRVAKLPDAFDINPTCALRHGEIAPYLEMSNMPTASARVIDWEPRAFSSGMRFQNGDVLVARITPCLENGKTAYVDFLEGADVGWGSTEYIVMRSKPPLAPEHAYFLARSDDFRAHAIVNMTGTSGRQRVPVSAFDSFSVLVSTGPVAERFGAIAGPVLRAMKQRDEESETLAALRDVLLPKLLSGEVRVNDTEGAVGKAV